MSNKNSQQNQKGEQTSLLEWAVALVGAILVAGTVGYLGYYGVSQPDAPPNVTVSHTATHALSGGYLVEFTAANHGNSTAAGLVITGALGGVSQVIEEREATLDYLFQQAQRKGGLFFEENPDDYELRLLAGGYAAP